jgi:hypothetical protein
VWAAVPGPGQVVTADITAFAQQWSTNPASNLGVMIDMGVAQGYCRVNTVNGAQQLKVEITYTDAPPPPPTTTTTLPPTTTTTLPPPTTTVAPPAVTTTLTRPLDQVTTDQVGGIPVNLTNGTGNAGAYIALAVHGSAASSSVQTIAVNAGAKNAQLFFNLPSAVGTYVFRYFGTSGAALTAQSAPFSVVAPPPPTTAPPLPPLPPGTACEKSPMNILQPNDVLAPCQFLRSRTGSDLPGRFKLVMGTNGNLYVVDLTNNLILWDITTRMIVGINSRIGAIVPGSQLHMNQGGWLVVYDPQRTAPNDLVWQFPFAANGASRLKLSEIILNNGTLHGWDLTIENQATANGPWTRLVNVDFGYVGEPAIPVDNGTTGTGTLPPPPQGEGMPFEDGRRTPIEVFGASLCVNDSLTSLVSFASGPVSDCFVADPNLAGAGLLLREASVPTNCLSSNGTSLTRESCGVAPKWSDVDPTGAGRYPDVNGRFPIWYRSGNRTLCLTRSGDFAGATLSVTDCAAMNANQIWTDRFEFHKTTANFAGVKNGYDYAAMSIGDRLFWCSYLGTDAIVNALAGAVPNQSPKYTFKPAANRLACDPHVIQNPAGAGFIVYYTEGVHIKGGGPTDGKKNGVYAYRMDANWQVVPNSRTQIIGDGQVEQAYGFGQPSAVTLPGGDLMLAFTNSKGTPSTPVGDETNAVLLDSATGLTVQRSLTIQGEGGGLEDGVSGDWFVYGSKILKLTTGDGVAALRRFNRAGDVLTRVTVGETISSGLKGVGHIVLKNSVDMAGIARNTDGTPKATPRTDAGIEYVDFEIWYSTSGDQVPAAVADKKKPRLHNIDLRKAILSVPKSSL